MKFTFPLIEKCKKRVQAFLVFCKSLLALKSMNLWEFSDVYRLSEHMQSLQIDLSKVNFYEVSINSWSWLLLLIILTCALFFFSMYQFIAKLKLCILMRWRQHSTLHHSPFSYANETIPSKQQISPQAIRTVYSIIIARNYSHHSHLLIIFFCSPKEALNIVNFSVSLFVLLLWDFLKRFLLLP